MNPMTEQEQALAKLLASAWQHGAIAPPEAALVPPDARSAHLVQHRLLALQGQPIAGWKVGAKTPEAPGQCAPLPRGAMQASPATIRLADHPVLVLELELAFRLNRRFEPSTQPHTDEEVLASIASVCTTIEVVGSRYIGWPNVDRLLMLADLQNHGALVVGESVAYDPSFPFVNPTLRFAFDDEIVLEGAATNTCGDPRRLLAHAVRHSTAYGFAVTPEQVLTCGSYTGMFHPKRTGTARGRIEGLPEIVLTIT